MILGANVIELDCCLPIEKAWKEDRQGRWQSRSLLVHTFLRFQLVASFHEMERLIQAVEVMAVVGGCIEE
jgi:hypothetical protein